MSTFNPLRLEHMTVFDAAPDEMIAIAEELGIPLVSVFLAEGAMEGVRAITRAEAPEFLRRVRDSAVRVDSAEVTVLQADAARAEPLLALAAELGAGTVVAIDALTRDESEAADGLAALAQLARTFGLRVGLEPISMGRTRTLPEGVRVIERSGAANAGLVVDLLHMVRTGTPVEVLRQIDPRLILSGQVCDGPASIDPAKAIDEAGYERGLPGTGAFPVAEFLAAIPASVTMGLEIPMRSRRLAGTSAKERTRLAVEATRRAQAAAAAG